MEVVKEMNKGRHQAKVTIREGGVWHLATAYSGQGEQKTERDSSGRRLGCRSKQGRSKHQKLLFGSPEIDNADLA